MNLALKFTKLSKINHTNPSDGSTKLIQRQTHVSNHIATLLQSNSIRKGGNAKWNEIRKREKRVTNERATWYKGSQAPQTRNHKPIKAAAVEDGFYLPITNELCRLGDKFWETRPKVLTKKRNWFQTNSMEQYRPEIPFLKSCSHQHKKYIQRLDQDHECDFRSAIEHKPKKDSGKKPHKMGRTTSWREISASGEPSTSRMEDDWSLVELLRGDGTSTGRGGRRAEVNEPCIDGWGRTETV